MRISHYNRNTINDRLNKYFSIYYNGTVGKMGYNSKMASAHITVEQFRNKEIKTEFTAEFSRME